MACVKEPKLKFRYAIGLGDIIASILHSKLISPITKFLTNSDKPCFSCSMRITAFNILVPIPLWKLFFKSEIEKNVSLVEDLKNCGYNVTFENNRVHAIKPNSNNTETKPDDSKINGNKVIATDKIDFPMIFNTEKDKFFLFKKNQMQVENALIVTLLYRKR